MSNEDLVFDEQPFLVIAGAGASDVTAFVQGHGGQVTKELPIDLPEFDVRPFEHFANRLCVAEIDMVIFQTGLGTKRIFEFSRPANPRQDFADMLRDTLVVAGGEGAARELSERRIAFRRLGEAPDDWRGMLGRLDKGATISNLTVAVEKTREIFSLRAGFEARGAKVIEISALGIDLKQRHEIPEIIGLVNNRAWRSAVFVFTIEQLLSLTYWLNRQFDTRGEEILVLSTEPLVEEIAAAIGYSVRLVRLSRKLNDWSTREATEIARYLW